jgi:hypothetical protein
MGGQWVHCRHTSQRVFFFCPLAWRFWISWGAFGRLFTESGKGGLRDSCIVFQSIVLLQIPSDDGLRRGLLVLMVITVVLYTRDYAGSHLRECSRSARLITTRR